MATNLTISENQERVPMTVGTTSTLRSVTPDDGSPYYVGARAYVTQNDDGATVTVIDKEGTTTANIYNGADGADGQDGADGNGIVDISLTSSSDNVDTYTITYTNGATDTFQVKNGENGSGSVADVLVDGTSVLDGDTAKIDLSGKADTSDIPTKVSELANDSGFITGYTETDPVFVASAAHGITSSNISTWNGKYTKPTGGIPKTDLATAVQTSLGKADTALQSYTETDPVFVASAAHGITSADITSWNNKSDFSGSYDDLTDKPTIPTVPSNVSAFNNDAGYLTSYTETDPTVPSWAKESTKPSYSASEISGLVDFFYPIGSYYETSDTTFNPNTAWGGTWSLEAEGKVHVSAGTTYTAGSSYGSDTHTHTTGSHTLTTSEIPAHTHGSKTVSYNFRVTQGTGAALVYAGTNSSIASNSNKARPASSGSGSFSTHQVNLSASHTHDSVGGGGAHSHGNTGSSTRNSWQPSIAVNRWHRTA